MTPDEARDLLDGTTPGPWELSSSRSVDGIDIVMYDGTEMERRNVALAAAAPVLAALAAGMREEWAREAQILGSWEWHSLGWCRSRAEAELTDWWGSIPRGATVEYRLVRRYVTPEEEIS